jgi:hypothetical protein
MRGALRWVTVAWAALAVACSGDGGGRRSSIEVQRPAAGERTRTEPLLVVWATAAGRFHEARWSNLTTGVAAAAQEARRVTRPCFFLWPVCPPEAERTTFVMELVVPLVPGENVLELVAAAGDDEDRLILRVTFAPSGAPSIAFTRTLPPVQIVEGVGAYVGGEGHGLVAVRWWNEHTGEGGALTGDPGYCMGLPSLTELTSWGTCVRLAAGLNRIHAEGLGWEGTVVEDVEEVSWGP